MTYRSLISPILAVSIMFAPAAIMAQETRSPSEAPYGVMVKCAFFNGFLASVKSTVSETEYQYYRKRAEMWQALLATAVQAAGIDPRADLEAERAMIQSVKEKFLNGGDKEPLLKYQADYTAICAPFGG